MRIENLRGLGAGAAAEDFTQRSYAICLFYRKLLSFVLILHEASQLILFYFFLGFVAPPKEHPHFASSGRHGERGFQQHSSYHQELPSLCRQEQ